MSKKTLVEIFIMVKEGSIFKNVNIQAAPFKVQNFKIENGILSFSKLLGLTEKNAEGEDEIIERVTEDVEFLVEEELAVLIVEGTRTFPIGKTEEEEDIFTGILHKTVEEE